jgi:hypothetical protein
VRDLTFINARYFLIVLEIKEKNYDFKKLFIAQKQFFSALFMTSIRFRYSSAALVKTSYSIA